VGSSDIYVQFNAFSKTVRLLTAEMQQDACLRYSTDIFPMLEGNLDTLASLPTRSVRVFLSSTFSGSPYLTLSCRIRHTYYSLTLRPLVGPMCVPTLTVRLKGSWSKRREVETATGPNGVSKMVTKMPSQKSNRSKRYN